MELFVDLVEGGCCEVVGVGSGVLGIGESEDFYVV